MSNDINYKLRFSANEKDTLIKVKEYLTEKKEIWENRGEKSAKQILKELGLKNPAEVVTWGFDFGEIEQIDEECFQVEVGSWANENSRSVPISGEDGELRFLLEKFPELAIEGTFSSEHGDGSVDGYELVEGENDHDESDHAWGPNGDEEPYNEATTALLMQLANGESNLPEELLEALGKGADPNAWMDYKPLIFYVLEVLFNIQDNAESEKMTTINHLIDHGLRLQLEDVAMIMLVVPGVPEVVYDFLKTEKGVTSSDLESRIAIFRLLLKLKAFPKFSLPSNFFEIVGASANEDRSIVEPSVERNSQLLPMASEALRADKKIVLEALKSDNEGILESVSPELRDDPEVVIVAVRSHGYNLRFASDRLRSDPSIVRAAVKSYGWALEYAAQNCQSDRSIVSPAVNFNGEILKFASEDLKDDRAIVKIAIQAREGGGESALAHASERLQQDPELQKMAAAN